MNEFNEKHKGKKISGKSSIIETKDIIIEMTIVDDKYRYFPNESESSSIVTVNKIKYDIYIQTYAQKRCP